MHTTTHNNNNNNDNINNDNKNNNNNNRPWGWRLAVVYYIILYHMLCITIGAMCNIICVLWSYNIRLYLQHI